MIRKRYAVWRHPGDWNADQTRKQKITQGDIGVIAEAADKPKKAVLMFVDEESGANSARSDVLYGGM